MEIDTYKAHIIFDCDGTLISSQESVYTCISEMMQVLLEREVARSEVIEKYTPNIHQILVNFQVPQEKLENKEYLNDLWSDIAAKHSNDHPSFPGIMELLKQLEQENYAIYVWTARDRASTLEILKKASIMPLVIEMRCLDDTTPKPHPQGIKELVDHVDKSKVMVIGDSFTDIQGATSYGCASIGALWSFHVNADELEAHGASYLAKDPSECLKYIQEHFN